MPPRACSSSRAGTIRAREHLGGPPGPAGGREPWPGASHPQSERGRAVPVARSHRAWRPRPQGMGPRPRVSPPRGRQRDAKARPRGDPANDSSCDDGRTWRARPLDWSEPGRERRDGFWPPQPGPGMSRRCGDAAGAARERLGVRSRIAPASLHPLVRPRAPSPRVLVASTAQGSPRCRPLLSGGAHQRTAGHGPGSEALDL